MKIFKCKAIDPSISNNEPPLTEKAFSRFFLTSTITLLVAIAALFSTTYAWYSASLSTSSTLTAACYDIHITVTASDTPISPEESGAYLLEAGKTYAITLERSEYATAENGYGEMILNGEHYDTEQINAGAICFTVMPTEDASAFFIPHIGTSTATEKIANGDILSPNA